MGWNLEMADGGGAAAARLRILEFPVCPHWSGRIAGRSFFFEGRGNVRAAHEGRGLRIFFPFFAPFARVGLRAR